MVRKAVGCLVTCWLNASHASRHQSSTDTHKTTELKINRFVSHYLSFSRSCLDGQMRVHALIKFYGIFELHKSNSVPVHIITKTLTKRKKRNENLVLYRVKWNTKNQHHQHQQPPPSSTHARTHSVLKQIYFCLCVKFQIVNFSRRRLTPLQRRETAREIYDR